MAEPITSAQMRAVEERAIVSGAVSGADLMERAGRGVVEAIFEEWPDFVRASGIAFVLCGPGNNGGDGYVVARLLLRRGWDVYVYRYGDPGKLPPDAHLNYKRWHSLGPVTDITAAPADLAKVVVGTGKRCMILDALFGIGLTRAYSDALNDIMGSILNAAKAGQDLGEVSAVSQAPVVVAVDVPSGLHADLGKNLTPFVLQAHLTVTFHRMKLVHCAKDAAGMCGNVVVKDIGL